jgi:hypothetical protein
VIPKLPKSGQNFVDLVLTLWATSERQVRSNAALSALQYPISTRLLEQKQSAAGRRSLYRLSAACEETGLGLLIRYQKMIRVNELIFGAPNLDMAVP